MRIMIKGGVWKNTEDEILKAAVMKYGKNQWSRISSLLVRKSAKQCKARWYEWLDPSIKKTEWTREEDEKLLHLAKLMPTQWRTIAPIVGRTPAQCLERYEKLLDAALAKDDNYEPADDPRRLRPGEIDPNPESKPARPDPVDMDEDEKEMLSEARARLANTRGKKAKRKAREKQLEEARRLASLQKRRELKAAGLDMSHRKRKQRGIDYNAEIPFEKKPPAGFFETSTEAQMGAQPQFPVTVEDLEGTRRVDIEEKARKADAARNKIVQRHDTPASVLQVNKLNDPEAVRKRSKLMLPPAQVTDRELEEIAKMGYANDMGGGDGDGPTSGLLASYGQTPGRGGQTPLRTPQRTPGGKGDAIMMEAENLARLRETRTPLLGGQNPDIQNSDFSGVTPKKKDIVTPNPVATPLRTPGGSSGATPLGLTPAKDSTYGLTPRGTPIRDGFGINEGSETPASESGVAEKVRQAALARQMRDGFMALPQPQNEYSIQLPPPLEEEEKDTGEEIELDMSEILDRQRADEKAREERLLKKRSMALQRDLPRPSPQAVDRMIATLDDQAKAANGLTTPVTLLEEADEAVRVEMLVLLQHDLAKYPDEEAEGKEKKGSTKQQQAEKERRERRRKALPDIEEFGEEEMEEAKRLLKEEISAVRVAMGHYEDDSADPDKPNSLASFASVHEACRQDWLFLPGRGAYGEASTANRDEQIAAWGTTLESLRQAMEKDTRKGGKLEQKLKVLTQGYQTRGEALWRTLETRHKEADALLTELVCFQQLHAQEQLAGPRRIEALQEDVSRQAEKEKRLQLRYERLVSERDELAAVVKERQAAVDAERKAAAAAAAAAAEAAAAAAAAEKARLEAEAKAKADAEEAAEAAAEAAKAAVEAAGAVAKAKEEEEERAKIEAEATAGSAAPAADAGTAAAVPSKAAGDTSVTDAVVLDTAAVANVGADAGEEREYAEAAPSSMPGGATAAATVAAAAAAAERTAVAAGGGKENGIGNGSVDGVVDDSEENEEFVGPPRPPPISAEETGGPGVNGDEQKGKEEAEVEEEVMVGPPRPPPSSTEGDDEDEEMVEAAATER
eukprot:TRINITY_DN25_c6_g1_i1.p1 TRINITY_DN25_c6_g1~~TRINITY_DN25_c6_g1_i1.p1  ORF type:complete len:1078 (+),score=322.31 TRINITY_DN25_c6_g1_i1:749-3982(+)